MKLLTAIILMMLALSQPLAQSAAPEKANKAQAKNKDEALKELGKVLAELEDMTAGMVFLQDLPLIYTVYPAPELLLDKVFREAQKNKALSEQSVFTMKAIKSVFKEGGEDFKALKDIKTREAAIKYAESVVVMSQSLERHLSGTDRAAPDVNKLIGTVQQRRRDLVAAFPLLSPPK
jgi:hypothetical protein